MIKPVFHTLWLNQQLLNLSDASPCKKNIYAVMQKIDTHVCIISLIHTYETSIWGNKTLLPSNSFYSLLVSFFLFCSNFILKIIQPTKLLSWSS